MIRSAAFLVLIAVAMLFNAPLPGPTLPPGTHWLDYAQASSSGPATGGQGILAATSLATIRAEAMSAPNVFPGQPCSAVADQAPACWPDAKVKTRVLYVAVAIYNECIRHTADKMAADNQTLLFVHWIGGRSGVCSAAMAEPEYRLYTVSRDQLPKSGTLDVKLLVEDLLTRADAVAAEVAVQLG